VVEIFEKIKTTSPFWLATPNVQLACSSYRKTDSDNLPSKKSR